MASPSVSTVNGNLFDKISFYLLLVLGFLIPFFFVPAVVMPVAVSKAILVSLIVPIAFIIWILRCLKQGEVTIPNTPLVWASLLLSILYFISAFFSPAFGVSFIGQGFEIDTFYWMVLMTALLVVVPVFFTTKGEIFNFYGVFWISTLFIVLYQGIRLILGGDFLSLGVMQGSVAAVVGSWNDLGVFFGLTSLLSLVTLHFFGNRGVVRLVEYVALLISLFFIAVVNFTVVWWALALWSVALIVFSLPFKNLTQGFMGKVVRQSLQQITPAAIVFLISVAFLTLGNFTGDTDLRLRDRIPASLGVSHIDARPSWQGTLSIALDTLKSDPLLGAGPNQFVRQWNLFKPLVVNDTIFWSTDFAFGVGLIPSAFVTLGLLGLVAWLFFLGAFLKEGYRFLQGNNTDLVSQFLSSSMFAGAAYLFLISIFYVPSIALFTLAFFFAGMFLSSLAVQGSLTTRTFAFASNPAVSFVSVIVLIILLALSAASLYLGGEKAASAYFLNRGVSLFNSGGELLGAEKNIHRAVVIGGGESAYRAYSDISLIQLVALVNQTKVTPTDVERASFEKYLSQALQAAREAVAINPVNYQNHAALARVYETLIPLRIPGSYESAKKSYEDALSYHPANPALYLQLARLEIVNNNQVAAREYISQALRLKKNYSEAIFLLSQLEVASGNTKKAIEVLTAAAPLDPNNPAIFFQLGLLHYNAKSFKDASTVLERAVQIESSYANAKYFLALSYFELGRIKDSTALFESIQAANPENKEVGAILTNLRSGRAPLSNIKSPTSSGTDRAPLPSSGASVPR